MERLGVDALRQCFSMPRDVQRFSNVGRMSKFLNQLPADVRSEIGLFEEHLKQGLINSDLPDHTRIRGLLSKAFTPRLVEAQRPRIQVVVDELLDAVKGKGQMDVIGDFAFLLPTTVIGEMVGILAHERTQFKSWADDITAFVGPGRAISDSAVRAQKSLIKLREYFRKLILLRRAHPQSDWLTAMANAHDQGSLLNDTKLLSVCVTLLLASYETTISFIGNAILALLRHPDQLQKLESDPSLLTTAIEELLRFDGPVHRQWRVATDDMEFDGRKISKGELVAAMLGAANRDPAQFSDPERLEVTRTNVRNVAFRYGIHFCLGAPLAGLEGEVAIRILIQRFPRMRLTEKPPVWRQEITIHGLKSLPIAFDE